GDKEYVGHAGGGVGPLLGRWLLRVGLGERLAGLFGRWLGRPLARASGNDWGRSRAGGHLSLSLRVCVGFARKRFQVCDDYSVVVSRCQSGDRSIGRMKRLSPD